MIGNNLGNDTLEERLKALNMEDYIWIIYLGIIFLSWYSNGLERKYFLFNDNYSKVKYRKTIIVIFSILIVVYLYFLKESVENIRNIKETDSLEKKKLAYLSFIGSLLIAISGFIFLYIAFADENLDIELAFN